MSGKIRVGVEIVIACELSYAICCIRRWELWSGGPNGLYGMGIPIAILLALLFEGIYLSKRGETDREE